MTPTICLAPLKGITDAVFRTTYAEFFVGIDWAIAPFLTTVQGGRVKPRHLKQVLPENNRLMPVIDYQQDGHQVRVAGPSTV